MVSNGRIVGMLLEPWIMKAKGKMIMHRVKEIIAERKPRDTSFFFMSLKSV